ncbi:MAG: DUF2460 domain-containing protein [Pseudomonadota bacterium]
MSDFHNVNLPHFLAIHAKGGPSFATSRATTASGREIRSSDRADSLQHYIIADCRLSAEQFDEFNAFFRARLGTQYAFCFKDYADCVIKDQIVATGDDQKAQFEIYKTYKSDGYSYLRRITKLLSTELHIDIDGTLMPPSIVCPSTGVITLESPLPANQCLTIKNAIFNVPVRFASDNFKYSMHADGSIVLDDLHLWEVI